MNANILKMQIFHKINYDLRAGHSRSQIMTFLIKNSPFLLFMLLIEKTNATLHNERTKFDLYKDDICLVFFCVTNRYYLPLVIRMKILSQG